MRIYAISSRRPKGGPMTYRNLWPYRDFFHGGDSPAAINRYGERPYKPLHLVRNVRLMPPVFFPTIYMVVSEQVAAGLRGFERVDLVPCVWEKVYDYPVDEQHVTELYNNLSHMNEDFSEWVEKRVRLPGPGLNDVKYFAVIAPQLEKLTGQFECKIKLELPRTPGHDGSAMTSFGLHKDYPIVQFGSHYLCTDPVYQVLEPYVADPDMFGRYCFDVEPDASGRADVQVVEGAGPVSEPVSTIQDAVSDRRVPRFDPSDPLLTTLLEDAGKLGEELARHQVVIRFKNARNAVAADPEAHDLWMAYSQLVEKLGYQDSAGIPWTDEQKREFRLLSGRVSARPSVKELDWADAGFYLLLRQISNEIEEKATGDAN